ncbi:hypothetical protein MAR_014515 [Mya arenaria]|uniref:Uncharacterized protein n=1 Tax=Mya arenaria TaxID=6604 RepID=A0ABY7GC82_MYAAR|nr:hypothetical protein MAR_014515 [Mya arenaria]
MLVSGPVLK